MSQMTKVKVQCRRCKKFFEFEVKTKDWQEYSMGPRRFIQDIFPYISSGQREIMISKICEECFDEITKEKEE